MEKNQNEIVLLVDIGDGYSFADGTICHYGEIIKAISIISNENIRNVFYEMSNKQYGVCCMEDGVRVPLTEGDKYHAPTDKEIARYPLPDFLGVEHTVSYLLSKNKIIAIGESVLRFLEQAVKQELSYIHKMHIDTPDGAVPVCMADNMFSEEVERILTERVVTEHASSSYIGKSQISYVTVFADGKMHKVYTIQSLAQLIEIEIANVIDSQLRYKKCPVCNMLFIDGDGKGEWRKYCEYPYDDGLCSVKGQKINEANKPEKQKYYKKFYDRVRGYFRYHINEMEKDEEPWEVEASDYHYCLMEENLSYEEHILLLEKWFENRKSGIKKKK